MYTQFIICIFVIVISHFAHSMQDPLRKPLPFTDAELQKAQECIDTAQKHCFKALTQYSSGTATPPLSISRIRRNSSSTSPLSPRRAIVQKHVSILAVPRLILEAFKHSPENSPVNSPTSSPHSSPRSSPPDSPHSPHNSPRENNSAVAFALTPKKQSLQTTLLAKHVTRQLDACSEEAIEIQIALAEQSAYNSLRLIESWVLSTNNGTRTDEPYKQLILDALAVIARMQPLKQDLTLKLSASPTSPTGTRHVNRAAVRQWAINETKPRYEAPLAPALKIQRTLPPRQNSVYLVKINAENSEYQHIVDMALLFNALLQEIDCFNTAKERVKMLVRPSLFEMAHIIHDAMPNSTTLKDKCAALLKQISGTKKSPSFESALNSLGTPRTRISSSLPTDSPRDTYAPLCTILNLEDPMIMLVSPHVDAIALHNALYTCARLHSLEHLQQHKGKNSLHRYASKLSADACTIISAACKQHGSPLAQGPHHYLLRTIGIASEFLSKISHSSKKGKEKAVEETKKDMSQHIHQENYHQLKAFWWQLTWDKKQSIEKPFIAVRPDLDYTADEQMHALQEFILICTGLSNVHRMWAKESIVIPAYIRLLRLMEDPRYKATSQSKQEFRSLSQQLELIEQAQTEIHTPDDE